MKLVKAVSVKQSSKSGWHFLRMTLVDTTKTFYPQRRDGLSVLNFVHLHRVSVQCYSYDCLLDLSVVQPYPHVLITFLFWRNHN